MRARGDPPPHGLRVRSEGRKVGTFRMQSPASGAFSEFLFGAGFWVVFKGRGRGFVFSVKWFVRYWWMFTKKIWDFIVWVGGFILMERWYLVVGRLGVLTPKF